MNLPRNETNLPFRLDGENNHQRAPLRTFVAPRLDIESTSLGIGEVALSKTRYQAEQSTVAARFKNLSFQVSALGKRGSRNSKRGQLRRRELIEIVDVVSKLPSIATRPTFDNKTITPLGMVLRSDNADLLLVQKMVEITIRHWVSENYFVTKHPTSECYPLNIPADVDGKLPLHVACKYGRNDIVRYLVSTYPYALRRRDNKGRLPIHTACAFGANEDVIEYLASTRPDTLWLADRNGKLPIHIASACGDIITIDCLVSTYRRALAMPDRNGRLPIHIACSTDDSDAIIDYLASTDPEALAKPDKDGKLPIDLVLEKRELGVGPSLPTIKKMLTLCPESLLVMKKNTKSSALGRLLFRKYVELEVLKTMVEVFPAVASEIVLFPGKPTTNGLEMDTDHAIEISKLFGKVKSLHLEAKSWTQRAFCHFMDQLGKAPASFRRLSLTLPAYDLSKKHSDTREAFQEAMAKNHSLAELRLSICQDDIGSIRETNNDAMMLESLARGLKIRGRPLNKLELASFVFPNVNGLDCLASTSEALVLREVGVMWDAQQSPMVTGGGPQSRVEELSIYPGERVASTKCILGLQLAFANLRKLEVDWKRQNSSVEGNEHPHPLECPHRLLSFIATASRLETLIIKDCRLDCSKTVKALRNNKSIRNLHLVPREGSSVLRVNDELVDLLEHHNSPIVDIEPILPSSNTKLQAKYEYLMGLNKYGRGELRDKGCQLDSLVSLISKVPQKEAGLLYGLLLERPDLWTCSSTNNQ